MTDLLTVRELADELGIDYEACKKRIQRAGLKPVRQMGRNNLYALEDVELLKGLVPVD